MVSKRFATAVVVGAVLIVSGVVAAQQGGSANPSIVGVWRVAEVTTTGPNGRKIANPQPGLRIFTQRHYSITEVTTDKPRPITPVEKATDKELADAWRPFISNAGTYEIKGDEITTRAIVAKNPNVMQDKSFTTNTFRLEGRDTLWITAKANSQGPVANPTTMKLTRVE